MKRTLLQVCFRTILRTEKQKNKKEQKKEQKRTKEQKKRTKERKKEQKEHIYEWRVSCLKIYVRETYERKSMRVKTRSTSIRKFFYADRYLGKSTVTTRSSTINMHC